MVSRHGRPSARSRARSGARRGQRDAGYNLVVLVMAVTTLNILVAKALPLWSAVIQREKEAELIFRGMQYAEAIRVYEKRTGALPVKLEQLIEVEPRCIRQLWKNPLDEDGTWEIIPAGQGQRLKGQNPNPNPNPRNQNQGGGGLLPGDPSKPDPSLLWVPGAENPIGSVPIAGVKSPVGEQAIKTFVTNPSAPDGGASTEISEWLFTVELAKALVIPFDGTNPFVPSMNVEQRFKPWPPGIKPINVPAPPGGGKSATDPRNRDRPRG